MAKGMKKSRPLYAKYKQLVNYTMLYDYGDECADATGGWEYKGLTSTHPIDSTFCLPFSTKTFQKNSDHIYLSGTSTASNKTFRGGAMTVNKLDMSEYVATFVKHSSSYTNADKFIDIMLAPDGTTDHYKMVNLCTPLHADGGVYIPNCTCRIGSEYTNHSFVFVIASGWNLGGVTSKIYHISLFKEDDISLLADKAGITDISIDSILTASKMLLSSQDAVEFMIYQCTGDFMANAITNSTFMTALASSPYKEMVYANEHWAKFLAMVA